MGLSYEEGIKKVYQGLFLLAGVTVAEVLISLLGKGHIIPGLEDYQWLFWLTGIAMIILSMYKAYFIIYEFMHMRYEAKGLALTVLLPTVLLIWGIIAFLWEGTSWGDRREAIDNIEVEQVEAVKEPISDDQIKSMDHEKHSNGHDDVDGHSEGH